MSDDAGKFTEVVAKLRARLLDAKNLKIGEDSPQDFALGMMMQLMNEAERQRQACIREMHSHRELAKAAEYQASAYAQVHNMAWAVYDGFIRAEEKSITERKERELEKAQNPEPEKLQEPKAEASVEETAVADTKPVSGRRKKSGNQ